MSDTPLSLISFDIDHHNTCSRITEADEQVPGNPSRNHPKETRFKIFGEILYQKI